MPARLTYPGVYVEEQSSGVRTITGVATSTTLFVGMARKGAVGRPVPIRGIDQFEDTFGSDTAYGELVPQVRQFFLNGGADAIITRVAGAGIEAASVTLRNPAGTGILELTAKGQGTLGQQIRAVVDYDTPTPELTFNMELYRSSVDANGATQLSENEFFSHLSMNPNSPRYAVTMLTQGSALVNTALPGAALAPTNAGFSQSAMLLPSADAAALADLNTALTAGDRLVVAVDGGAPVTATLPSPAATLAAWLVDANAVVNAALVSNGQPGGVLFTLEGFGANRAIRITSNGGTTDSVVVTSAAQSDAAAALQLGHGAGGIEIGRYSRFRPAPSGFTTELHTRNSGAFTQNADFSRLVDFAEATRADLTSWTFADGSGNPPYVSATAPAFAGSGTTFITGGTSAAGVGSLRNTRSHLDTLAASLAAGIGQAWIVRRVGYRITMRPNFGNANTGATAVLTSAGGYDLGGANGPALAARAANTQAYSLGSSGAVVYQTPGAPGNNGGVPGPDHYNAVYATVASEVDLFNLMALPRCEGQSDDARQLLWGAASAFCQRERAFLIVDPRADWTTVDAASTGVPNLRLGAVTDHAGLYWPRINVASSHSPVDPAGTIAGIMSRTDTRRGVWKAPAGLEASIIGTTGLEHPISDAENGVTNPQAINTLRQFSGGAVVWGARTMAGFDNSGENDYKYVPVRRTALFIEESLYRGLKFALFEPNDEPLWAQIRLAAGAFMQNLYRQGAFQGAKASDAYEVRCDASTTKQNDINLGRVNVIVAFAPLRPAEFVVLTVRQLAGQVQV
ncbi:phage tail sheath subtilisin-like domain-containing protein [Yoonia sp.]|uniref:phage tail sheath family protein n=1 Tax=Yoonia sp. TaxID=2212373 RepID=UPI0025DA4B42|nr:phage tail sheath subtilisin-like domain-containing protein [Yoonia sp.]